VHPQHLHALRERRVVRDAHAGIAERPQVLVGKNDRQPISPKLPARWCSASSAPMACAASSMT